MSPDRLQARPAGAALHALALAAMLTAGPGAPASAGSPADLEAAFDNTIVSTYPNGDHARLWLDRDGSYRGQGRRGDASSGHWSIKGDRVCLKQARPIPIPFSYCTGMVSGGVGTVWKARSIYGDPLSVELVGGR